MDYLRFMYVLSRVLDVLEVTVLYLLVWAFGAAIGFSAAVVYFIESDIVTLQRLITSYEPTCECENDDDDDDDDDLTGFDRHLDFEKEDDDNDADHRGGT